MSFLFLGNMGWYTWATGLLIESHFQFSVLDPEGGLIQAPQVRTSRKSRAPLVRNVCVRTLLRARRGGPINLPVSLSPAYSPPTLVNKVNKANTTDSYEHAPTFSA